MEYEKAEGAVDIVSGQAVALSLCLRPGVGHAIRESEP